MENMEKELEERELKERELMNENENREFYVYVHIRLDNNTVFYVGKGTKNRAYNMSRGEGTHHDNICKTCDCKVVIIKDNLTESQAFRLESKMIKYYVHTLGYGINIEGYNNYDHKLPHLTNSTWGGEGVSGLNPFANKTEEEMEEIGKKISEKLKGKNVGEKNGMFGKKGKDSPVYGEKNGMWGKKGIYNRTEEEKKKIREKVSKKIICITTGEIFSSAKEASEKYGGTPKCAANKNNKIKYTINKNNKSQKLYWVYLEDYNNEYKGILIHPTITE